MKKIGSAKVITNYWLNSFWLPLPSEEVLRIKQPLMLCLSRTGRSLDPVINIIRQNRRADACGDHADLRNLFTNFTTKNHDVKV